MCENLPFCACGCGERVSKVGNRFIHGHNCGNQGKKHPGMNVKSEISEFVEVNQGKHICKCGCGGIINIMSHHFIVGIPEFIHGHNRKKKDVIKLCNWCGKGFIVKGNNNQINKKFCCNDCRYEYQSDVMEGVNCVDRVVIICKQCNKKFKVRESELDRKFCSHKCYTNWYSENLIGDANSKWKGGMIAYDARRRELGYEPLNNKFPGSDGHHVTKTLVIHIPKKLHQHVGHNLRTGRNMDIINILAFQYLSGCYNE